MGNYLTLKILLGPSPLCQNGGVPDNITWFSFIAGEGDYFIEVEIYDVIPGAGGEGVQAGMYLVEENQTSCWGEQQIFCREECIIDNIEIQSDLLIPGRQYLMFLDGCFGTTCSYDINIYGDISSADVVEPFELLCQGKDQCHVLCPSTEIQFEVLDSNLTYRYLDYLNYYWSYRDENNLIIEEVITNTNKILYKFNDVGDYKICLDKVTGCNNTIISNLCQPIEVIKFDDEDFGTVEICGQDLFSYYGPTSVNDEGVIFDPNNDGLSGWQVPGTFFQYGPNSDTVTTALGCKFEQTVEIVEIFDNFSDIDTAVCGLSEFPLSFLDFTTNSPVEGFFWIGQDKAANGCDSILNINAYNLEIDGYFDFECVNGAYKLIFIDTLNELYEDLPIEIITTWYDEDNIIIPGLQDEPNSIFLGDSDSYRYEVVFKTNFENGKKEITCPYVFEYKIDSSDYSPTILNLNWDETVCSNNYIVSYTFETNASDSSISLNWEYPNDVEVMSGIDTDSIVIDWSQSTGGQLCLTLTNSCGVNQKVCKEIIVVAVPEPDFIIVDSICIDSLALIQYVGSTDSLNQYLWNFQNGIANDSLTSEGPHQVYWTEPGIKSISLIVSNNGCESEEVISFIDVVEADQSPFITCSSTINEVVFQWNSIPGISNYEVIITSGQNNGVLDGNSFIVGGLVPGEGVNIILKSNSINPCGPYLSYGSCKAMDCITYYLDILSIDTICLSDSTEPIILEFITDNPNNFTAKWEHPAIIDSEQGVFDPNLASEGDNIIMLTLIDELGCNYSSSIIITIKDMISSVNDLVLNSEIKLFPNPTTGEITVSSSSIPDEIEVFDMNGRLLQFFNNTNSFNIQELRTGLYLIKLKYEDKLYYKRIIKN